MASVKCLTLSDEQTCLAEKYMRISHDKRHVVLKPNQGDVKQDWAMTLAAVYRSLLILFTKKDPMNANVNYSDLATDEHYKFISNEIGMMNASDARTSWQVCRTAKQAIENNKDLSLLYKQGFDRTGNTLSNRKQDFYRSLTALQAGTTEFQTYTPNMVWELLGKNLQQQLRETHPAADTRWLTWGFF